MERSITVSKGMESAPAPTTEWVVPPRSLDPLAGILSYLVPGLGQIIQGRVAKGVLFFFCIHTLFFWGLSIGQWKNVYLPRADDVRRFRKPEIALGPFTVPFPRPLAYRVQFLGQFWVGMSAWPAILQWLSFEDETSTGFQMNQAIIPHPVFGMFMRTPPEAELNQLQTEGDKIWELGWAFTVIAGILNLLVIYDAFAGPAYPTPSEKPAGGKGTNSLPSNAA